MPSMFGDKFGGFRIPFTRPRANTAPTNNSGSFNVLGSTRPNEAQGFQVLRGGQRPGANSAPATPAGWSLSPATPHPGSASPRSGSPENYQQANFGGDSPLSPTGRGPLRITNPDPQSPPRTPSPTPASSDLRPQGGPSHVDALRSQLPPLLIPGHQAPPQRPLGPDLTFGGPSHPTRQHPDSLIPGRVNPGPTPLTPDLTFEQPVRQHPASLTPGHGSPSSLPLGPDLTFERPGPRHPQSLTPGHGPAPRHELTPDLSFERPSSSRSSSPDFEMRPTGRNELPARPGSGPQTFGEMGFVNVQKRTQWYNPATWGKKETHAMLRTDVDPRKHTILPSPPSAAASSSAAAMSVHSTPPRTPSPETPDIAQPEPRRPGPRQDATPASSLAQARENLRAMGRRVPEPPTFGGESIQRPSRPGLEDDRNRL